ncbi:ABC transporter permease subunit [Metamycoplasma hyosynoviae]|uniref:ABC transporter permease subunit n=1 Tax=Metamycoplasma hyosynoviae TaxID=29559 RepID=UPI002358B925|nr:hypothetical protein [Metamycoplasma hyosynoviae]MDC8919177.1 hypothetical protein [Metamycoplasma hyosynoviae]MDD1373559.1 hypothetical protein [Metamycoplasma hyosynoviae]MDD1375688.1 hypothetical protein [Metamycoplasma hyosynoviae]MDD1376186.1 hypothetical protein [Metamycoplasma hyosynoviae]MDD1376979.1 hypothetical protein [Metamycoplasma hyosynoviae]
MQNSEIDTSKLNFWEKLRFFFRLEQTKSNAKKVISSIWSIVFGLLFSLAFIAIVTKNNPFLFFSILFKSLRGTGQRSFFQYLLVFGFIGLSSAIGFKSGLFNIGISGQMMSAGFTTFAIFIMRKQGNMTGGYLFLSLMLSMIVAFLFSLVAGALKAYLNVHEVISTILINWIIVNICLAFFTRDSNLFGEYAKPFLGIKPGTSGVFSISKNVENIFLTFGYILLIASIVTLWGIYRFTTLGYKLRMLGLSKTNGQYMGINEKLITMLVMGISGLFAGIGGFYFFVVKEKSFNSISSPHNLGFEAIAISLLALNSPIGISFTSLFYALLYNGQSYTQLAPLYLPADYYGIVTSLILYLAAISQVLNNFKPMNFIWKWIVIKSHPFAKNYSASYKCKQKIDHLEYKKQVILTKIDLTIDETNKDKLLTKYLSMINNIDKKIHLLKQEHTLLLRKIELMLPYASDLKNVSELKLKLITLSKELKVLQKSNESVTETRKNEVITEINSIKTQITNTQTNLKLSFEKITSLTHSRIKDFIPLTLEEFTKQFTISQTSKVQSIKSLKQKANQQEKDLLLKTLDSQSNKTSIAVVENFQRISILKRELNEQITSLKGNQQYNLKQNYKSAKFTLKNEYNKNVNALYEEKMYYIKEYLNLLFSKSSATSNTKGGN